MRSLVIYDTTGRIYAVHYNAPEAPQGIDTHTFVDIQPGAQLVRMDVTDPANPVPVYAELGDPVTLAEEAVPEPPAAEESENMTE